MAMPSPTATLSPLRAFLLLRYALIAATAYLLVVEDQFAIPPVWTCLAIALALLSNVFASALPDRVLHSRYFTTGFVLADTAWVSAALIASGRFDIDFFFIYFFVLLLAAMAESLALIAVAAVAVCIAYLYVLSSSEQGWTVWSSPSIIRLPFLFTAAAFYGYMIDRTRREERRARTSDERARVHGEALVAVSRQIRSPIASVLSWSSLLTDTSLDPEQRRYVGRIRRCGEDLLAVSDGILDAATIQAGNVQIESVVFEPQAVVEEVCALYAEAAAQKGLTLVHRLEPAVPLLLRGARGRVRQVLSHLVDNALKFSTSGEVRVDVRVASSDAGDVCLRFDVTDPGVGIAPEQQAGLFAAFGGEDETDNVGSSGLGLAVSRQLVRAMGGEMGVESVLNRGSTFWFTSRCSDVGATADPMGGGGRGPAPEPSIEIRQTGNAARNARATP